MRLSILSQSNDDGDMNVNKMSLLKQSSPSLYTEETPFKILKGSTPSRKEMNEMDENMLGGYIPYMRGSKNNIDIRTSLERECEVTPETE
jgi:hypothetical protein